ncbi:hypothetical protein LCGC14_1038450 [marine sediment metagenome]|uniref:Rieske domain-containing protein n=1 Tax=marine sediment metagenome TaxID=412755 RepID=A0A0F9MX24_9ZZZZ|nr:Rieske (2Fe-2S) protein [Methylophaga sp.]HEC58519.1 Rieske (2Fe-2S) protein [Methylophaga sp.]
MSSHFLCHNKDLAELQSLGFTVETEQGLLELFLVRQDDKVQAYQNHCPHLGIPLNWQPDQFLSLEGLHIQCSTHGALFNVDDGHCIVGPCVGQNLITLPIEHRDDEIWLALTGPINI